MRLNKATLWLTTMVVLAGCPAEEKPTLGEVTVSCSPASVVAGQTTQCAASAKDKKGQPFTVSGYTWTSNDESVAKVDATGKVTTLAAGTAAIRASASAEGVTQQGQASVTVTQPAPQLTTVTVTCSPTSVEAEQTSQCSASATDQYGQPFTVSSYSWTSSDESVAKVDATGKVTTLTAGTTAIHASATVGGVTQQGQATLTVALKPTVHDTSVTTNETWRAANNPHVVRGSLEVSGATTLTIEAGVELRFEQDAELRVTSGALRALGTEEAPIRMVARQSMPTKGVWRGVVLAATGSDSELSHVTLSHCGASSGKGACLALENQAAPVLRHVAVRDSGTAGVGVADDGSAFGTGSTTLSVSASQSYAVRIGANQAGTLPSGGTFTDNAPNAIELRGNVTRSQTWPNLSIPYVVNGDVFVEAPTNGPTLTIPAGTVLRFGPNSALLVGWSNNSLGALIVDGTAASPVLFTADSVNPQPGQWAGVFLGEGTSSNARLSHTTIEYGGSANTDLSGLKLQGSGVRLVIDHVTVQKSSGYGIQLTNGAAFGPGSTMLSVRDNGNYPISIEPEYVGTIPTGGTFSGNGKNGVELAYGGVGTTQTWPNLGIPYVVTSLLSVGSTGAVRPTLTLLPGTEVRFDAEAVFLIGGSFGGVLYPGSLKADGTYEEPIRFAPNTSTPTKGYWAGLHFWAASGSALNRVTITHAGRAGPLENIGTGNLNVYRAELGDFVGNSNFNDSAGCGITVSDGSKSNTTKVTMDYSDFLNTNNRFSNNTGADQCIQ